MAGPYMGGYTPPNSYGNYGYNGYGQQMYQSPVAQQLTRMENQYPQYGQTMQPQYQQGQPMQNNMPQGNMPQQQPQQMPSETFLTVGSIDEARNYLPDMSGTRQIFAISSDPNKLVAKRFNIGDASTDFVVFAPMQEGEQQQEQNATEQAETDPQAAQSSDMMEDFKKQFEAMQEQHKQLQNAVMEMKEDFNAKLSSLSADDDKAKPADGPSSPADTGMGADGGKPTGDNEQSSATESGKSNPRTAKK